MCSPTYKNGFIDYGFSNFNEDTMVPKLRQPKECLRKKWRVLCEK